MQNRNSLKNAFVWMAMFFVGIFVSLTVVGCSKDDVTGHDNTGNTTMSIKVEKRDTTPEPIYRDSSWVKVSNDTITIVVEHFKNDTLINADSVKCNFGAKVSRVENKLQTTEARLANLDFSFGEVTTSRNGKNQFVGKQQATDEDGQTYNGELLSGYATLGTLSNVHAELVSFKKTNLKNTELEPGADEAKLVNTNIAWSYVVRIVNAPNLAGKEFELTTNNTEHLRFIPKNAPEFIKYGDWKVWKETGNWNTVWHFECNEYWSNDSVAPKSKLATLKGSYSRKDLDDKTVSGFDYTHPAGDLKWGNYAEIESKDAGVKLFEKKGTKKAYATNGFDADKFDTEFTVTMQKADVMFCDSLFHVESDEATLTNQRNVFVDEDSDRDGYQMLRFTDTEVAKWNGEYNVTLDETCKLYLKVAAPAELDKIEFVGTKVHTNGMAKIDGSVIPVYSDGSKGGAISFKFEKAESWTWLKDSVIFENVDFAMEETGKLTLKGEEKKTAKTFATDNENITIKCNQYDADFQTTVKVDGQTKVTTWHATWFEDFKVVYNNKSVSLTKSSYEVKNQNDKLSKDEARSTATTEFWGYSVEGIFSIDEDSRSAMGYGRLTKAIEEVVINEGWDKFSFETDAKEYTDRVEYFLKWIREYSTGKKTSQEVKVVLKRNAEGSAYTITVDNPIREIGSQSENSSYVSRTETSSDIVINYDWKTSVFELPNYFDGSTITKNDIATFVDPTNVKVTKKNSKGEDVEISLPSFEHELTSTVSDLQKVSETEELVEYTYTRTWNWASTQCTSSVKSIGNINKVPDGGAGEPDFDIEVGKIIATVSRPSNRDAADITAYTYLLVSKDGTKCLPLGFYNGAITVDEKNGIVDYVSGMNSACYVKNENKVVATTATLASGIIKYKDANGNMVDGGMFLTWQGAGFNDRGNDYINHTGKYAPHAEKKGNVYVVTFEGTNVSYTFRGWNVQ